MIYFSVVIPHFNRAHLIKNAINSVLEQSFISWELIIADDASHDEIDEVIESYGNSKITLVKNSVNLGNAGARNLGARVAKGKYITFLDSDDAYKPDYLKEMYSLIQKNKKIDFAWANVNRIDQVGTIKPNKFPENWKPKKSENIYRYFLKGLYFGTDFGFLISKNGYNEIGGFDENLRVAVDTDFILRCSMLLNYDYTDKILIDTYDHEGERVRNNALKKAEAYDVIYKKHQKTIEVDPVLKNIWFSKMLWLNYHAKRTLEARKYFKYFIKEKRIKVCAKALIFELLPYSLAKDIHVVISKLNKVN